MLLPLYMSRLGSGIEDWTFGCFIDVEALKGDDNPNSDWYNLYYKILNSEDTGVYKIVWPDLVEKSSLFSSSILYIGGNPKMGPLRDRLCDHIEGKEGAGNQQKVRTNVIQKIASNDDFGKIRVDYMLDNLNPGLLEKELLANHLEEFGMNPPLNSPYQGRPELLKIIEL